MRSKEVEEAINFLKQHSFDTDEDFSNVKTISSYIETLEQLPNKIRDKIKELKEKTVIAQGEELLILEAKIDMLEEIIGE